MENYLDEKAAEEEEEAMYETMLEQAPQASKVVAERRSLVNNSVKRKGSSGDDVDHVFLRFGKRGWTNKSDGKNLLEHSGWKLQKKSH